MSNLLKLFFHKLYITPLEATFNAARNFSAQPKVAITEENITNLLKKKFPDSRIQVQDVSGGCGDMFKIFVESKDFIGIPLIKQHQAITDTLKKEIKSIHGIQIETKTPQNM